MSRSQRCLVLGSINCDEVFHLPHTIRPGETLLSTSISRCPGGKGANQAYAVAMAGGGVDMRGCIGVDGVWLRDFLGKAQIGVEGIRTVENEVTGVEGIRTVENEVTGRAIILLADDGENSIGKSPVVHRLTTVLSSGANAQCASPSSLEGYSHALLQNEIPLSSTIACLHVAAPQHVVTVFNPSPVPAPDELRTFPWHCISWLIVNEGELFDLVSACAETDIPAYDGDGHSSILDLHHAEGFDDVGIICTQGARGILYFHPTLTAGKVLALPAAPLEIALVDTTGAGDCFAGTFVAGLMRGEGLEDVLKVCLAACAACVEAPGAMASYASWEDIKRRSGL